MDKETALEMIDVLKEMNQNILRCMNQICENTERLTSIEAKVDDFSHKLDMFQTTYLFGNIATNSYLPFRTNCIQTTTFVPGKNSQDDTK